MKTYKAYPRAVRRVAELAFLYPGPSRDGQVHLPQVRPVASPTWAGRCPILHHLARRTPTARPSKGVTSISTAKPKDGRFSPTCSPKQVSMTSKSNSSLFIRYQEQPLYWHADVLVGSGIKKHSTESIVGFHLLGVGSRRHRQAIPASSTAARPHHRGSRRLQSEICTTNCGSHHAPSDLTATNPARRTVMHLISPSTLPVKRSGTATSAPKPHASCMTQRNGSPTCTPATVPCPTRTPSSSTFSTTSARWSATSAPSRSTTSPRQRSTASPST